MIKVHENENFYKVTELLNMQNAIPEDCEAVYVYQGEKIQLDRTISSYNIQDQYTIHVSFKNINV